MSIPLMSIVSRAIHAGYAVSSNDGLKRTTNFETAYNALRLSMAAVDELTIRLWTGERRVASIYLVFDDGDNIIQDYTALPEAEAFVESLI